MNAATIGEFIGFSLACAGVAYIWLGLLWAVRVYKRWPRFSYWSAAGLAAFLGAVTAFATPDSFVSYLVGTALVVGFVLFRGIQTDRKRSKATGLIGGT